MDLLVNPERNWSRYALAYASNFATLPNAGGWDDQPEDFLHDMAVFSRRIGYLRQVEKHGKQVRKDLHERLDGKKGKSRSRWPKRRRRR